MLAVMKSDDVMAAVAAATDADSLPLQDQDPSKPGLFGVLFDVCAIMP